MNLRFLFLLFLSTVFQLSCSQKTSSDLAVPNAKGEIISQEANSTEIPLPMDETVKIGTLENGLTYYIKKNAKPENKVELRIALKAGSILEDEDQQGLAHFVEHMAFNGSKNFKKNELVNYLESVGAQFGPDLNAYTSFDETVYMLQVRNDEEGMLEKGLTVLEDWAGALSFEHEEIDKERGVVISEWRSGLNAEQRMQQNYLKKLYNNSQYAKRLPIGLPKIINEANYETIKRYYQDWYRPNLMAIIVVGDIDVAAIEKEIKDRFSKLVNPTKERIRKEFKVPHHDETVIAIENDDEAVYTQVQIYHKLPRQKLETDLDYKNMLSRYLFKRMLDDRLSEIAQTENPPFNNAYTWYGQDVGDIDTYYNYAFCQDGKALEGLRAILTENERVLQHGFLNSELERTKKEMLRSVESAFKEKDNLESGNLIQRYINHFLKSSPIPSPEQTLKLYEKLIPKINLENINSLAEEWITEENRVIIVTGPKNAKVEINAANIQQVLNEAKGKKVKPFVDNVIDQPLIKIIPQPGKIIEEQSIDYLDVKKLTLSNGVEVYLKKTDFKADEILMRASSKGGYSLYPESDYPTTDYVSSILQESGLGDFDLTQLNKYLAGKRVGVSASVSEQFENLNGYSSPQDLETLLQLVHLNFTSPRKDAKVFNSYMTKEKSVYENLLVDPYYYFWDQVGRIQFDNHQRSGYFTIEELDKVDLERAYQIYRERFADADDFFFVFAGNYDETKLKKLIELYLGSLPSLPGKENVGDLKMNYSKGPISKTLKKGTDPKSYVSMTFHGDIEYNNEQRYALRFLIDAMKIKMRESMREDKGGVYGVDVSYSIDQYPKSEYAIFIEFNTDPPKTEELIKTALLDIQKTIDEITDQEYIDKIKETQTQSALQRVKENGFWVGSLVKCISNEIDLKIIQTEEYQKYIDALTGEKIQEAAKKYFNMDNFIQVVMHPE